MTTVDLALVLIIIGIIVGVFLNWTLGIILVVVGLVLLVVPYARR